MRQEQITAKAKGKDVATATIDMPESLAEAIAMFSDKEGNGGEARVLKMALQQYKIGELNRIRDLATGGVKIPKAVITMLKAITDENVLATVCAAMNLNVEDVKAAA